jgi:hypothetical protein
MMLEGFVLFAEVLISTLVILVLSLVLLAIGYNKIKEMLNDD